MNTEISSAQIARFHAHDNPDAIAARMLADGVVIVRAMLDRATLDAFNAEIDGYFAGEDDVARSYMNGTVTQFFGPQTRHLAGLAGKSAVFRRDVLCHPVLMAQCERILRPHCATYQLNFADVMDRWPGAAQQIFHRDDGIWPYLPPLGFPLEFATMIALGPFTAERGATLIVPGSHRWEKDRVPQPHEIAVAEMEPGDAAFYLGSTLHAGGENTTDQRRRGMHLSYCLGWLRTEDNNYLTAPIDLVRTLPRDQQAILGYALHDGIEVNGGFLGAVDWRNPLDLMAEGRL
ncbi:putative phytanoyl-CoA dioxygenase [Caenibius tardaugens NBRC 16725]|uniref:Putative phytanoyl-CoA dioxygenase n=1 Tax=Caenibius tardaugens NBRC 16725 TaxID=1219035 RepID=U2Y603_9SPHN|nr:phytanoyl-CoA dioxygenase family protein [Caenibius tardaugens]GAD48571.1 putative phytanoyl-CoA dioxygenase [Caenibius tardaugens NBRC 16725]